MYQCKNNSSTLDLQFYFPEVITFNSFYVLLFQFSMYIIHTCLNSLLKISQMVACCDILHLDFLNLLQMSFHINKQQKIKQKRISLGKHILELTVKCHLLNTFFLKVYSLFFFSALTSQQSLEILLAPFGLYFTVGERETHSPGWTGKTP